MRRTLVLLAALWIVAALVALWSPWRVQLLTRMGVVLAIAGVVFVAFAREAMRNSPKGPNCRRQVLSAVSAERTEVWSRRALMLFLIALLGETAWLGVSASLGSAVVLEGGYYLILLAFGYALSNWGKSKEYVPVLMAILVLLVGLAWQAVQLLGSPSARFRFGPEIIIIAASQIAGRLAMLPLDSAVIWGAWQIGESAKRASDKALQATPEPPSGADSSARPG